MKIIQIYGPGCKNCEKLFKLAKTAVEELGYDFKIEKINELNAMVSAGIMRTPGLAFDRKIILQGKLPTLYTLKNWISKEHAAY